MLQLPTNILSIGEIENDDVRVYIKQDVYKALEEYAASDVEHELGTILVGSYSEDLGKTHVVISDYILAKYTDASASTLTFTHETWDYVHKEHAAKHPDKKIIGWQHTHPSYGIFLSNYDMFIQENFFNLPFQIAYVIDPVQHLRGFFQWKNGKVVKLTGFYLYDEVGTPISIKLPKTPKAESSQPEAPVKRSSMSKLHLAATALLALLTIGLLIATLSLSGQYKEQSAAIAQQQEEIRALRASLPQTDGEATPEQTTDETDALTITFRPYTVQAGDTLISICQNEGIDYAEHYRIILGVNGITNPNRISEGQTLLLPVGL